MSESKINQNRTPSPASSLLANRSRRLQRAGCAVSCLLLIVLLFWLELPTRILKRQVQSHLDYSRVDEAEWWSQLALTLAPRSPNAHLLQARVLRKQNRVDEMGTRLLEYVELGGDPALARREEMLAMAQAGQLQTIFRELDRLLVNQDRDLQEVCEAYLNGLMANTLFNQGFVLATAWEETFPLDARPHYYRGRGLEHLHRFSEAEAEYQLAIDKQPDHTRSLYALGRYYLTRKEAARAKVYLGRCLAQKRPAAPRILYAQCLMQIGSHDQAKELLLDVQKLTTEELRTSFQRVGERLIGRPDAALLGQLESEAGNHQAALEHYETAFNAAPDDLDVRYARALVLRQLGKAEESARELTWVSTARQQLAKMDRVIDSLDPLAPDLEKRLEIAQVYLKYGSLQTAEYWLRSILGHEPQHTTAKELLAVCQDLQGNPLQRETPAYWDHLQLDLERL